MKRGFVVAGFGVLAAMVVLLSRAGSAAAGPGNIFFPIAPIAVHQINKTCPNQGQFCYGRTFEAVTTGHLSVLFTASPQNCTSIRVHISLRWDPWTSPLRTRYTSPYLAPGEITRFDFGPVPAGRYSVDISAEGTIGGCNTGRLAAWAGELRIQTTGTRHGYWTRNTCYFPKKNLCDPPYSVTVTTTGGILVRFQASHGNCGSFRVHIATEYPLGVTVNHTSEYLRPGDKTAVVYLLVPAGTYTLRVQAEGAPGGCIVNGQSGWDGTVEVWAP